MKRLVSALLMMSAAGLAGAADVGVSVTVGEPGFYGQINIGNVPRPVVVNPRPVIIERGPTYVETAPIYVRVPPGHKKHWKKHCHEYNACGRPVYFVTDRWYNEVYVPRYREAQGYPGDRGHGHDHGRGHGRD